MRTLTVSLKQLSLAAILTVLGVATAITASAGTITYAFTGTYTYSYSCAQNTATGRITVFSGYVLGTPLGSNFVSLYIDPEVFCHGAVFGAGDPSLNVSPDSVLVLGQYPSGEGLFMSNELDGLVGGQSFFPSGPEGIFRLCPPGTPSPVE